MAFQYIDLGCPPSHVTKWALMDGRWYYRFVPHVVLEEGDQGAYYVQLIDLRIATPWSLYAAQTAIAP